MAYIYSNEVIPRKNIKKIKVRDFCSVCRTYVGSATFIKIGVKRSLVHKACLGRRCVLGYDKSTNKLIIVPSIDGDMVVGNAHSIYINCTEFFNVIGINDLPVGRYEAIVDNDCNIVVNFNCPLPQEEQYKSVTRK